MVSFPHFYQADPKYINAIEGMNPNKEEHETYLDLNPVSLDSSRVCVYVCGWVWFNTIPSLPLPSLCVSLFFKLLFKNGFVKPDDPLVRWNDFQISGSKAKLHGAMWLVF